MSNFPLKLQTKASEDFAAEYPQPLDSTEGVSVGGGLDVAQFRPQGLEGGSDDRWFHDELDGELDAAWHKAALALMAKRKLEKAISKHLPHRHDQKKHGRSSAHPNEIVAEVHDLSGTTKYPVYKIMDWKTLPRSERLALLYDLKTGILYASNRDALHEDIIRAVKAKSEDVIHLNYSPGQSPFGERIAVNIFQAGTNIRGRRDYPEDVDRAYKNIYRAFDALVRVGAPESLTTHIEGDERKVPGTLKSLVVELALIGVIAKATAATASDAQLQAGNYKKKHLRFQGMEVSVENLAGSVREGKDKDGKPWRVKMHYDYGYIRRTEGTDGDHVDVYIGPDESSDTVYVVHQAEPETGRYDEDKCMLGFGSEEQAKTAYLKQYDSPKFFGAMTAVPLSIFKEKVFSDKGEPVIPDAARRVAEAKLKSLIMRTGNGQANARRAEPASGAAMGIGAAAWETAAGYSEGDAAEVKAGTAEGARKAWLLRRRRQLVDQVRAALQSRDAKALRRAQLELVGLQRLAGTVAQAKHLAGQHDQTTHAGERGVGDMPGQQVGGQAAEQSEFARTVKGAVDPQAAWKVLAPEEKDRLSDAANSIHNRFQRESAEFSEADLTGSLDEVVSKRLAQIGDKMMPDAHTLVAGHMKAMGQALAEAGVPEAQAKALLVRSTDALAIQEHESMGRQLGDHGARHLLGDAAMALEILRGHPSADSPQQTAAVYLASIFHDTGYTTEPGGTVGMDGRHPQWSKQYYDAQVGPAIAEALGQDWAAQVGRMVETHADTNLDWKNDPMASALRVADNVALFHAEKLPGLYKYVPQNIKTLMDLGAKKIDVATARAQMAKDIAGARVPDAVKQQLLRASQEVGQFSPKFTLGMLGGSVKRLQWQGNYLNIMVNRNRAAVRLQQHLDLGQRQFLKFAEAFLGEGAKEQLGAGGFVFGKPPQLKFTIGGEVIKALTAELRLRAVLLKHLAGKHDQLTHGRKQGGEAGERVWTGEQQQGPTARGKMARLELGERGEMLAERVLEELSGADFQNLNSAAGEHSPLDLVGDNRAVEVKAGKASNSKSAQQWRITAGEPGMRERLRMLSMRPGQLRAYNRRKSEYLVKRKQQLADQLSKALGRKLQPVTVGIVFSPDNRRADVFLVPGFHARLGWTSYAKEPYYAGTYDL